MTAATVLDLTPLFAVAPRDWTQFVPCRTCKALRQERCIAWGVHITGPARQPHEARRRDALTLHATLWLLAHNPTDVLGVKP